MIIQMPAFKSAKTGELFSHFWHVTGLGHTKPGMMIQMPAFKSAKTGELFSHKKKF